MDEWTYHKSKYFIKYHILNTAGIKYASLQFQSFCNTQLITTGKERNLFYYIEGLCIQYDLNLKNHSKLY